MTDPPDYSSWLTKQQAADAIKVTTKSIERFVQAGKIQQARWRPSGRGPELAVYEPSDVARVAAERQSGPLPPFLMPAAAPVTPHRMSTSSTNGNGHHPETPITALATVELGTDLVRPGTDVLRAVIAAVYHVMSETSQTARLFLSIPDASAVSGLTQAYLKRAIADGRLPAIRDRGWRIKRTDLEAL